MRDSGYLFFAAAVLILTFLWYISWPQTTEVKRDEPSESQKCDMATCPIPSQPHLFMVHEEKPICVCVPEEGAYP